MRLICFGHKPLEFSVPRPFTYMTAHPIEGMRTVPIDEVQAFSADASQAWLVSAGARHSGFHDEVLSEYTQLFALARLIERLKVTGPLYLFQYRKFISLRPAGRQAKNAPFVRLAKPAEMADVFPTYEELAALQGSVLRGQFYQISTLISQYALSHHVDDLALFTVVLRELGILTGAQCARFLRADRFVPAPTVGMYPAAVLLRHAAILRKAWKGFYGSYYMEREGPQRRVGGFLLERLHSFLITEELATGRIAGSTTGQLLVATNSDDDVLRAGA